MGDEFGNQSEDRRIQHASRQLFIKLQNAAVDEFDTAKACRARGIRATQQ